MLLRECSLCGFPLCCDFCFLDVTQERKSDELDCWQVVLSFCLRNVHIFPWASKSQLPCLLAPPLPDPLLTELTQDWKLRSVAKTGESHPWVAKLPAALHKISWPETIGCSQRTTVKVQVGSPRVFKHLQWHGVAFIFTWIACCCLEYAIPKRDDSAECYYTADLDMLLSFTVPV